MRVNRDLMSVQVLYFGLIRNLVGAAEEALSLPAGATVRQLFDLLADKHGAPFRDALFTAEGTLLANAIVLLDGKNILYANGLDTEIPPDSSAHILLTMTAIGGG
ncbi:MAG: MoaD/ThiS family protein [Deltaproteobacteria bacterium]|nr:MoaD/ThiS family protein [Deltaproteobacteria bacterium]